ncbi:MAG: hypothetical protein PHI18_08140, partial [bacterium]|nr:hypothetical protein [bacterium]
MTTRSRGFCAGVFPDAPIPFVASMTVPIVVVAAGVRVALGSPAVFLCVCVFAGVSTLTVDFAALGTAALAVPSFPASDVSSLKESFAFFAG